MRTHLFVFATLAMLAGFVDGAAQRMALRSGRIHLPAGSQHAAKAAAHCVDGERATPELTDSFNYFSGKISVTKRIGEKSESASLNDAIKRKWLSVRGDGSPSFLEFVPLDTTAEYVIDIPKQADVAVGGADPKDVEEYATNLGGKLTKLVESLDQVSDEATKVHPNLGKSFDIMRQRVIWALPLQSNTGNPPDIKQLKLSLRSRMGLPNAPELPEGATEILIPKQLAGANPVDLAKFFEYKLVRDEKLSTDLPKVNAQVEKWAEFGEQTKYMAESSRRAAALEIVRQGLPTKIDVTLEFEKQMRSVFDLTTDVVPSLEILELALKNRLEGIDTQEAAKLLNLKIVPNAGLKKEISEVKSLVSSITFNDADLRSLFEYQVRDMAFLALRGELPAGSIKEAFHEGMKSEMGLPDLTSIGAEEIKVLLPEDLAKLPARKLEELFGIPVKEPAGRKIVRLDFNEDGANITGSEFRSFDSLEEAAKSLKQKGDDTPEVLVSRIPSEKEAEILHRHGIHFIRHVNALREELMTTSKKVKIIVVSSLDRKKAGQLFETENEAILDSIRNGTKALQKAADEGADISIVESRAELEKILADLDDGIRPAFVLHNPGSLRIHFEDGFFDLMDGPDHPVFLTCDSYRLEEEFAGQSLVSTGVLRFERLAKSVIGASKKIDGVPPQDKSFLRAVEADYGKVDKAASKGVNLAMGVGSFGLGSGILYGFFGGGGDGGDAGGNGDEGDKGDKGDNTTPKPGESESREDADPGVPDDEDEEEKTKK